MSTMNLFPEFASPRQGSAGEGAPLADRMRPTRLEGFVGQQHLVGPGKPVRLLLERDRIGSLILWGPPGTGKTTLARIIAQGTRMDFVPFSAVLSGIKEIRSVMQEAERNRRSGRRTLLFIDEIHRFNKAQQDAFLPFVETGAIVLIGATTENPSFEVNPALLSRCKVYQLEPLSSEEVVQLLRRSLRDRERGMGADPIEIEDAHLGIIADFANGDARVAYNTLEIAVQMAPAEEAGPKRISEPLVRDAMQRRVLLYDKAGEEHYNLISALHKSLRNSDPDAAIYWLARMLEAGEDPLYVARRLVRFASEDVGMADPHALTVAVQAKEAFHFIGLPEGTLALAQAAVYLATAPKSNALDKAYAAAVADVKHTLAEPVPLHLRNAPTRLMKTLGYGRGYQYAHDFADRLTAMSCLPESLKDRRYFRPSGEGFEEVIRQRLRTWREKIARLRRPGKEEGSRSG